MKEEKLKLLVGTKFSRLVVMGLSHSDGRGRPYVLCRCDCGAEKSVSLSHLRSGSIKSCGCIRKEQLSVRFRTHGMTGSRPYTIWASMKSRTTNKAHTSYAYYGGRGIEVCERWAQFDAFWEDMGDTYREGLTIDRKDSSRGYCKDNCRWITQKEQTRNTRRNVKLTAEGKSMLQQDWAALLMISHATIYYHLKKGKPFQWIYDHFKHRIKTLKPITK